VEHLFFYTLCIHISGTTKPHFAIFEHVTYGRGVVHFRLRCKTLRTSGFLVKNSPYSITERRVPELIPVLGIQPAGDVSHKSDGRLPLLSARPAVTLATFIRAATNFAAW